METTVVKQEAKQGLKENTLKRFESLKTESLALANQCKSIKIADENTLSMAQQVLSKSNQLYKSIEEKRSEIKKPYLDAGKTIDSIAKEIMAPLEEGLKFGKQELQKWNDEQVRLQKEKEEENAKIVGRINKIREQLQAKVSECNTPEKCKNLIDSINKVFPAVETFKQYAQDAKMVKDNFITLLQIRRQTYEAALSGNVDLVAQNIQEIKAVEAENIENAAIVEEKKELITENNTVVKSAVRKAWKYEVVDLNSIPFSFFTLDDKKVKEYMAANKTSTGTITPLQGIKFVLTEAPVIR